ncbi:Structural maintenance of chromosomes protein 2 [Mycoemilia scoparia]|uniref:Structural maintenance of chromosomes protein 2 n=1 Tax=Mycoemilia scoparia TaxID=417184 RepID=A0A9W8DTY8_9FUNG|nr:Structural maintenance of chromosomes protein 2 [Mycoemilia scoparia]
MRVEELIIDGFKSYATRTHITGWDAEFNAITGLNGSGKSNILDAICFVLGIKNMKLLRASNLQDLIYKRGQAGITKASVTIVFNNEDRATSPLGYEDYQQISLTRQIMVGGKNKYLINGHNAQEQAVFNMLQSVQLNVNNPHFLIMQGKITQVLNMQPPEILSMIEEAAGTRMFEERKDKALKTIGKKERKIEEISAILNDEITPKLDKLRKEKSAYLEFKKVEIELDRLRRLTVAYDYTKNEEKLAQGASLLKRAFETEKALEAKINNLRSELENLSERKSQIEAKKAQEMHKDSSFRKLESKVDALSKDLIKIKTQFDLKATTAKEEEAKKTALNKSIEKMESSMSEKLQQSDNAAGKLEEHKRVFDEKNKEIARLEELIQSLTTGVASDEGREGGFIQQLQEEREEANASATMIEQSKLRTQLLLKEKKELKAKSKRAENDNDSLLQKKKHVERRIEEYQSQLLENVVDDDTKEALEARKDELKDEVEVLYEKQQDLQSRLRGLNFRYEDPHPNFDRSKVKGQVAELITLESRNKFAATALELCAGGQLYNVIVKDDQTGAELLERGRLRQRFTILPLNRLTSRQANPEVVNFAKSLAPGKVDLALSLITYDKEVEPAMVNIFGNTLVCKGEMAFSLM